MSLQVWKYSHWELSCQPGFWGSVKDKWLEPSSFSEEFLAKLRSWLERSDYFLLLNANWLRFKSVTLLCDTVYLWRTVSTIGKDRSRIEIFRTFPRTWIAQSSKDFVLIWKKVRIDEIKCITWSFCKVLGMQWNI